MDGKCLPTPKWYLRFKTLFCSPLLWDAQWSNFFAKSYVIKRERVKMLLSSVLLVFFYLYTYWEEGIYKCLRLAWKPQCSDEKFGTFQFLQDWLACPVKTRMHTHMKESKRKSGFVRPLMMEITNDSRDEILCSTFLILLLTALLS